MIEILERDYWVPMVLRDAPGQGCLFPEMIEDEIAKIPKSLKELWT